MNVEKDIVPGTWWRHHNGNMYLVIAVANTPDEVRYPKTVVYQGENANWWARRADDWHRSMTLVPDYVRPTKYSAEVQDAATEPLFREQYFAIAEAVYHIKSKTRFGMVGGTISLPGGHLKIY